MYPCEYLCTILEKSAMYGTKQANQVIKEFLTYIQRVNKGLFLQLAKDLMLEPKDPMVLLRVKFLAKKSVPKHFTKKFYEILQKYNYHEESEILECISYIAENYKEQSNFSFWKQCPWIQEISFDPKTKMFTIYSSKGVFSFLPISQMYQREIHSIRTIAKSKQSSTGKSFKNGYQPDDLENFDYNCHFVTHAFSQLHPESYAVTCICPNCFPSSYWLHSYNISYNQAYIIDIANNFVMATNEFNRLIHPNILDQTLGGEIPNRLEKIEQDTSWPFFSPTQHVPLKTLAFYQFDHLAKEERTKTMQNLNLSLIFPKH